MTIIENQEYETEIKKVCDTNLNSSTRVYWKGVIITVILFLITIIMGAYLRLPDAILISIVIAVASVCVISIILERTLELGVIIICQTATIEWIGKKQFSKP